MKATAFLIASLFAMSLSLTACGGNTEETPASDMDTTTTEMAPTTPTVDTIAPAATPIDTAAAGSTMPADTTVVTDTTSK